MIRMGRSFIKQGQLTFARGGVRVRSPCVLVYLPQTCSCFSLSMWRCSLSIFRALSFVRSSTGCKLEGGIVVKRSCVSLLCKCRQSGTIRTSAPRRKVIEKERSPLRSEQSGEEKAKDSGPQSEESFSLKHCRRSLAAGHAALGPAAYRGGSDRVVASGYRPGQSAASQPARLDPKCAAAADTSTTTTATTATPNHTKFVAAS